MAVDEMGSLDEISTTDNEVKPQPSNVSELQTNGNSDPDNVIDSTSNGKSQDICHKDVPGVSEEAEASKQKLMNDDGVRTSSKNGSQSQITSAVKYKFRILGLHHPSEDLKHPKIVHLMGGSQSFHLWFEKDTNDNSQKKGGISFTFSDEDSAREAYLNVADDLIIGGIKLKIQAPPSFKELLLNRANHIPDCEVDPERFQKLYVTQLVSSTDCDLIYAIFGEENLKHVDIHTDDSRSDGSKCALLTFCDREAAEQARQEYDEFTIDDGEISRPMRIMLYVDYLKNIERLRNDRYSVSPERSDYADYVDLDSTVHRQRLPKPVRHSRRDGSERKADVDDKRNRHTEETSASIDQTVSSATNNYHSSADNFYGENTRSTDVYASSSMAPCPDEMTVEELRYVIENYMERERTNWAELTTIQDLWTIAHQASKCVTWQPEASLKEAMAAALERALQLAEADWQREHLTDLHKLWAKELQDDSRSHIRKQMQLMESSVSEIAEQPAKDANSETGCAPAEQSERTGGRKKGRKASKKTLMHMMGVGAMLADVQKEVEEVKRQEEKAREQEQERKRKHSASESGEASTTTDDEAGEKNAADGDNSDDDISQPSSSSNRFKKAIKSKSKTKTKKRTTNVVSGAATATGGMGNMQQWMNTMMQAMSSMTGGNVQQYMAQAMPMMMQMMPMMAQMMQMRMMTSSTAGQPQQMMMQQMMSQMMQHMNSASVQTAVPHPPPVAPVAAAEPNSNSVWLQRPAPPPTLSSSSMSAQAVQPMTAADAAQALGSSYFNQHMFPYGAYDGRGHERNGGNYALRR